MQIICKLTEYWRRLLSWQLRDIMCCRGWEGGWIWGGVEGEGGGPKLAPPSRNGKFGYFYDLSLDPEYMAYDHLLLSLASMYIRHLSLIWRHICIFMSSTCASIPIYGNPNLSKWTFFPIFRENVTLEPEKKIRMCFPVADRKVDQAFWFLHQWTWSVSLRFLLAAISAQPPPTKKCVFNQSKNHRADKHAKVIENPCVRDCNLLGWLVLSFYLSI